MLYLLRNGHYAKVGYTKDRESYTRRMKAYATHNPSYEIVGIKEGSLEDEKEYHRKLKGYRVKNEWFNDCIIDKLLSDGFEAPEQEIVRPIR